MATREELLRRFYEKCDRSGGESACWAWTAARRGAGGRWPSHVRGAFSINRRTVSAHRASWTLHRGPIPAGMQVCHACDNPICVNPTHLFLGTHRDNMRDMAMKGRSCVGERQANTSLSNSMAQEIALAVSGGRSQRDVAAEFGVDERTVSTIANGRRFGRVTGISAAPVRRRTRLSTDDYKAIARMIGSGRSAMSVAREFGVSGTHVIRIMRGQVRLAALAMEVEP